MTLDQIRRLVKLGESDTLEFNEAIGTLSKGSKTLFSFLNHQGGTLLIGVKDNGDIVGLMVSDKTRLDIVNEIRNFQPPILVKVEYVPIGGEKSVIAITVASGQHKPYVYNVRPYQRIESSTNVMPQHLYEQCIVDRGQLNHTWDEYTTDQYHIKDLDAADIKSLVKQGSESGRIPNEAKRHSLSEILSSLDLIENGKLTNAAIVLFAKKVRPVYSQCILKMARFRGAG